jgi:hypothetical protein
MAMTIRAEVEESEEEQARAVLRSLPSDLLRRLAARSGEVAGLVCEQVLAERSRREGLQWELEKNRSDAASFKVYVSEWQRLAKEATGEERARLETELESYKARLAGAIDSAATIEAELAS